MDPQWRVAQRYRSPHDPCPPQPYKYIVPPNQYVTFQPPGIKQWSPQQAFCHGVLWPELYSPYGGPPKGVKR